MLKTFNVVGFTGRPTADQHRGVTVATGSVGRSAVDMCVSGIERRQRAPLSRGVVTCSRGSIAVAARELLRSSWDASARRTLGGARP